MEHAKYILRETFFKKNKELVNSLEEGDFIRLTDDNIEGRDIIALIFIKNNKLYGKIIMSKHAVNRNYEWPLTETDVELNVTKL